MTRGNLAGWQVTKSNLRMTCQIPNGRMWVWRVVTPQAWPTLIILKQISDIWLDYHIWLWNVSVESNFNYLVTSIIIHTGKTGDRHLILLLYLPVFTITVPVCHWRSTMRFLACALGWGLNLCEYRNLNVVVFQSVTVTLIGAWGYFWQREPFQIGSWVW